MFQDVLFGTDVPGTGRISVVETNTLPLVDGKSFVGVHEPRNVTQPVKVDRDGTITEEKSAK